jgi:hypothetical protein
MKKKKKKKVDMVVKLTLATAIINLIISIISLLGKLL